MQDAENNPWLTLANASGVNDGVITVNVAEKPPFIPRSATIKISMGGLSEYVFVEQAVCIPPWIGWNVVLRLKPQKDENFSATEAPEIIALIEKHGVVFRQRNPGANNPELLLYYNLGGEDCNTGHIILQEFLATGLFEDYVRIGRIYSTL